MNLASTYAAALHSLVSEKPNEGAAYLKNLKGVLERRGHLKLFPRIFSSYQELLKRDERLALHREVSPEKERTRVLLELYRRLLKTN